MWPRPSSENGLVQAPLLVCEAKAERPFPLLQEAIHLRNVVGVALKAVDCVEGLLRGLLRNPHGRRLEVVEGEPAIQAALGGAHQVGKLAGCPRQDNRQLRTLQLDAALAFPAVGGGLVVVGLA
jgi:hypothetical protein